MDILNTANKLRVNIKSSLGLTIVTACCVFPLLANAISLGRITTHSMQNEPLDADILLENTPDNLDPKQLHVGLASSSDFQEVGLALKPFHKDLKFSAYKDSNLQWYVKVQSSKPVPRQFVNFLVTVDHPNGKILREYMVILQSALANNNSSTDTASKKIASAATTVDSNFQLVTTKGNNKIVRATDSFMKEKLGVTDSADSTESVDKSASLKSKEVKQADSSQKANLTVKFKDQEKQDVLANNKQPDVSKVKEVSKPQVATQAKVSKPSAKALLAENKQEQKLDKKEIVKAKPVEKIVSKKQASVEVIRAATNATVTEYQASTMVTSYGDSLWNIAVKQGVSKKDIPKMMVAIYKANSGAFIRNNINLLKTRAKIVIPGSAEVDKVTLQEMVALLEPESAADKATTIAPKNIASQTVANAVASTASSPKSIGFGGYKSNLEENKLAKSSKKIAAKKPASSPSKIRISAIDGDIANLQISEWSESKALEAEKQVATQTALAKNKVKAAEQEIIKLTSIKEDLVQLRKFKQQKREAAERQKLRIIAAGEGNKSTAGQMLLASEKLIAKQKENKDLKEQVLILQAQLKDLKKVIELKEVDTNKQLAELSTGSLGVEPEVATDAVNSAANNPLLAIDYLPDNLQAKEPVAGQNSIALTGEESKETITDRVVNTTSSETSFAAKTAFFSLVGSISAAMTRVGTSISNFEFTLMFWLWFVTLTTAAALLGVYYYWRRNFRTQPATPEFMGEQATRVSEDALREDVAEDEQVGDDIVVTASDKVTDTEINANFDLVNAYIELNDFVTAKKILDEIMQAGNNEQQTEAKKLLESIPA